MQFIINVVIALLLVALFLATIVAGYIVYFLLIGFGILALIFGILYYLVSEYRAYKREQKILKDMDDSSS